MGLPQELATVAAPAPATAAAAEKPAPPEWKTNNNEPDLKKRKENDSSVTAVVAADQHNAADMEPGLKKRKVDQVTCDGEEAHLFLVDAASTGTAAVDQSKDDHGASIVHNKEAVVQDKVGSPRGSAAMMSLLAPRRRRRRRKLLILDLNGLLADINQDKHNAHLSHGKFRGKLVFKRPYCDDFLRFCIQHFELGIWSSRLRVNVDAVVNILMKDLKHHLLFCWDMSKCTGTGLNTLENKDKPLVLKELKKLWDKEEPDDLPWQQGDFSPSNTLLVDDSPYKALRNPPHTAIFPCPYSYKNDKDDALGPDGDLRLYLESLATADDVQRYVKEHPFGQPAITETDPDWDFYKRILLGFE